MNRARWTAQEDIIILDMWEEAPMSEILAKLPGRTRTTCTQRACILGVNRRRKWTAEEDGIIRETFPTGGGKRTLRALESQGFFTRTLAAVRRRALTIGARYVGKQEFQPT